MWYIASSKPTVFLDGKFCRKSTWRHVHELGLTALYMANDDVKKFVGMMDGLASLPLQDIAAGVVIVRNFMSNPALAPLLTYFLQTYVGVWVLNANNQMVSRPPLFPLLSWNGGMVVPEPITSAKGGIIRLGYLLASTTHHYINA